MITQMRENPVSHGWLLDKYSIVLKDNFQSQWEVEASFWTQSWDMGVYPMAISQTERDKIP